MAKSSKKMQAAIREAGSTGEPPRHAPEPNAETTESAASPKAATKTARKRSGTAGPKSPVASAPRKTSSRKKAAPAQAPISDEEIRIRAYFIAEKRARQDVPGDSSSDWLEARRQLLAESAGQA
jgi:hypothetical protein